MNMKTAPPKPRHSAWIVERAIILNGRPVHRGDEITVRDHDGRRLRVRFVEFVQSPEGGWITVSEVEKDGKVRSVRSFDPSKVLTVHRDKKLDIRRPKP